MADFKQPRKQPLQLGQQGKLKLPADAPTSKSWAEIFTERQAKLKRLFEINKQLDALEMANPSLV